MDQSEFSGVLILVFCKVLICHYILISAEKLYIGNMQILFSSHADVPGHNYIQPLPICGSVLRDSSISGFFFL